MKLRKILRKSGVLLLSFVLLGAMTLGVCAADNEVRILLSDTGITVDGAAERLNGIQEVSGSIPLISTKNRP